ncbi:hypothetical protein LINGRAHAP2_LOCUS18065 [Linum grandiflorum]
MGVDDDVGDVVNGIGVGRLTCNAGMSTSPCNRGVATRSGV